ncbi:response regulator transcription factor [uncultured Microbulbifer sp.]|uniref:helix-turn-helix transcriptional regulator n=1 Tax=uncultured Microbulbifer sp. TaxID=348147 RepID=UPI002634B38F|nr:response regulator transcription factor [uncultured Microbulbifer sp.]
MNLHKDYARLKVITAKAGENRPSVVFLTSCINIQTSIFTGKIEDEFNIRCVIFRHSEVDAFREAGADYLILDCADLTLADLDQLLREVHEVAEPPNIVLINIGQTEDMGFVLYWERVLGLMPSESEPKIILERLKRIFSGEYWFPRDVLHNFLRQHRKPKKWSGKTYNLTRRERQILQLICDCHTNANIAEALCVSEHTVKSHLYKIYRKIGCKNRLEASGWASQNL